MINNTRKTIFVLLCAGMAVFVCSCWEHRKKPRPAIDAGVPFHLVIRAVVGDADFSYDSVYHSVASRAFTVTDFRYYVSNVLAIRDDGTEHKCSRSVILVDPHQKEYDLGLLPEGSYRALCFTVGLDSAVNHGDPTVFAAGNPLAIQTPGMHWDWNSGYLFMKLEGRVATTTQNARVPDTDFFYHIGMDRMKRVIDLQTGFIVGKSLENRVRLKFDLARLLSGIDMKTEKSTHSFDHQQLARRMADNWQKAFSTDH